MLKNKNTLIVFISAVVVLILGFSVVFQFSAIKEVKTANGDAQDEINKLNEHLNTLNSALKDTLNDVEKQKQELEKNKQELAQNEKEIEKQKQELKKYQEILNAWNSASLQVRESVEKITSAYYDVMRNSHLYPKGVLGDLENKMMDAVYCAIRSTTPRECADDFVKGLDELNPKRFDVALKGKIESVKADGVLFPEDVKGFEDALAYYNSFINDPAVMRSFAEEGFDKELVKIFEMLDADEEKDLSKEFVDAVDAVDLPVTVATSLKNAILAWEKLQNALEDGDVLDESVVEARAKLDAYISRIEELAGTPHNCADCIRAKLNELLAMADATTRKILEQLAREIEAWLQDFNLVEANRCLENFITDLCPCPHVTK